MPWTEVDLLIAPQDPWRDILMVELSELGFEAFEETTGGLKAFIPTDRYDRAAVSRIPLLKDPSIASSFSVREHPDRNWNAEWEKSFEPVRVGTDVLVRAEFHPTEPGFTHELVITPRMAFGTGHHATTRLMIEAMLALDLKGTVVCDLGCGTAILAMLAERLGAERVVAIDNDPNAVANANDNLALNACNKVFVEKGDAGSLKPKKYDAILANIERNTLLRDMSTLVAALRPAGNLLLSGFLIDDVDQLSLAAKTAGMGSTEVFQHNEWAMLLCRTT